MSYDYETVNKKGTRYGFEVDGNQVNVYVNDKLWGSPQGDRFIAALIDDIKKLNNDS